MNVLLVSNYIPDGQISMRLFGKLLHEKLPREGLNVKQISPDPVCGRLSRGNKWAGYVDKMILFRKGLASHAEWADCVHILDHSNAFYTRWLPEKPVVVTCHDVIAIMSARGELTGRKTRFTGRVLQNSILKGLGKARHIACVSRSTMNALVSVSPEISDKTSIINYGLNHPYAPMDSKKAADGLKQHNIPVDKPFFLHVGKDFWYKNRPGLIRIFSRLARYPEFSGHNLIMAGEVLSREEKSIVNTNVPGRVFPTPLVDGQVLSCLYNLAEALIFPSLHEGFGWPLIEAQACGLPVFTSNRPPMTEVCGDGAVYFDPCDPDSAAEAIRLGLKERADLVKKGLVNASRFSADKMAESYARIYKNVV